MEVLVSRNEDANAEREEWSYRDFLALLVAEETAHRQQTRAARMVRRPALRI